MNQQHYNHNNKNAGPRTFLHSLEWIVPVHEFHRDGYLLCLQDLIVQVEVSHGEAEHLIVLPRRLVEDGAYQKQKY